MQNVEKINRGADYELSGTTGGARRWPLSPAPDVIGRPAASVHPLPDRRSVLGGPEDRSGRGLLKRPVPLPTADVLRAGIAHAVVSVHAVIVSGAGQTSAPQPTGRPVPVPHGLAPA
jgi:hypothetical protein